MITDEHRSDCRRHLRYPAMNYSAPSGMNTGGIWPLNEITLDAKLDQLTATGIAKLTGSALGGMLLAGNPQSGDTITLNIFSAELPEDGVDLVIENQNFTLNTFAHAVAAAINANVTLQAQRFFAMRRDSEVYVVCPETFSFSVMGSGGTSVGRTAFGSKAEPAAIVGADDAGIAIVKYGYLSILNHLQNEIAGATQNLDTRKADVWEARADEVKQREALYERWQRMLSEFLGVPINPFAQGDQVGRVIL